MEIYLTSGGSGKENVPTVFMGVLLLVRGLCTVYGLPFPACILTVKGNLSVCKGDLYGNV